MNANNTDREALNSWIRDSMNYDPGIDMDAAIRDPGNDDNMQGQYMNDTLHPNEAGYEAMAQSVQLTLLTP